MSCLLFLSACQIDISFDDIDPDNLSLFAESIPKQEIEELDTHIALGTGILRVGSCEDGLLKGNFYYEDEIAKAKIEYRQERNTGLLVVHNDSSGKASFGNPTQNFWEIELQKDIPLNLSIETGVCRTELDLQNINLLGLEIVNGIGECTLNLNGKYSQTVPVEIVNGIGRMTLILPGDFGVKINVENGIGKVNIDSGFIKQNDTIIVNEAYSPNDPHLKIDLVNGIGEFNIEFDKENGRIH